MKQKQAVEIQNKIIEEKNILVETQNKDIKDSIKYAQKRTAKRVLIMILMIWLLSAFISLPVLFWNSMTQTIRNIFFNNNH